MKKINIIFGVLILSVIALVLMSFNDMQPGGVTIYNGAELTITTSSSLDTVTWDIGNYNSQNSYEIQINGDSISGATGADCVLELSMDKGGSDWVVLETITVNGVTTRLRETGTMIRGQLQCRCFATDSTQVTNIRMDFVTTSTYK